MPTPAERLATLEAIAQENRRRLDDIYVSINGGPGVEFSVAGAFGEFVGSVLAGCAVVTAAAPYVAIFHGG